VLNVIESQQTKIIDAIAKEFQRLGSNSHAN
jgi:hypothetical protein